MGEGNDRSSRVQHVSGYALMSDTIAAWHAFMAAPSADALDPLVADDCTFTSPGNGSVHTGKAAAMKRMLAAAQVLNGDRFHYVGEWRAERSAVLEFTCTMEDGTEVNGVDMIGWNDAGQISTFKVMIRPIGAMNAIMPLMRAALAQ